MKVVIASALAALCWAGPAVASDFGDIRELTEAYNAAAKRLGQNVKATKIKCHEEVPKNCDYAAGQDILLSAYSIPGHDHRASMIVIVMPKDRKAGRDYLAVLAVAIMTWPGFTTGNQRNEFLSKVEEGVVAKKLVSFKVNDVEFQQKFMPEIGLMMTLRKTD